MYLYWIEKLKEPSGYAYVLDFKNNRVYYGPVAECERFVNEMEKSYFMTYDKYLKAFDKYMKEV